MGGSQKFAELQKSNWQATMNYNPPTNRGADKSSHKQKCQIRITFGTLTPDPNCSHNPPRKSGNSPYTCNFEEPASVCNLLGGLPAEGP